MGLFDFLKPKKPDPFDIAIDIAKTAGASPETLERLAEYRRRPADFYRDQDMQDGQFGAALYHLLNEDGLVYIEDPGDFPENVASNFFRCVERFGYRWEPQQEDLDVDSITYRLIAPGGESVETTFPTPGGLPQQDKEELLNALVELLGRTSLAAYEIPIVSEQRWFLVTRKASFEELQRRYGPRWKVFFSAE